MVAGRGWLVALEGLDGAGTTTQARRLVASLEAQQRPAAYTSEPSDGPFGTLLRQILTASPRLRVSASGEGDGGRRGDGGTRGDEPFDEAALALAFAADRLDHLATEIEPALARGATVVCDRYVLSSLAYQGRALDLGWLQTINALCRPPDLTFYLDVPVEVCLARMEAAQRVRERYEQAQILAEVAAGYARAIDVLRQAGQRIVVLDGTAPIAEVERAILGEVRQLLAIG